MAKIIDLKAHLTVEGLNEIKLIRLGGNKSEERNLGNAESTAQATKLAKISFYPFRGKDHDKNYACAREGFSLVLYGNIGSTVGSSRYKAKERALIQIPTSKMSVFLGIILAGAQIKKRSKRYEPRLQFEQKYNNFEYFYSIFFNLSHYCSRGPKVIKTILHKKVHYNLSFTTRSLLCISELYDLFYDGEKKCMPNNLFFIIT